MMIAQFRELPIGARFNFRARRYEKIALDRGMDEERCGNLFHASTEVSWDVQVRSGERGMGSARTPASAEGCR